MEIDEKLFRAITLETIEENPLACRAALAVDRVEFSGEVETLSVSLGRRSVLRANPDFIRRHCATEKHVKALLVHEYLHVALGHTINFGAMTPELNVALDAVINAVIHRKLGGEYSSMMASYYGQATGLLSVLRPMDDGVRRAANAAAREGRPVDPLVSLHAALYNGTALADDILSIARDLGGRRIPRLRDGRPSLLGDHSGSIVRGGGEGEGAGRRLRGALACLDGCGVFRDPHSTRPQVLRPTVSVDHIPGAWKNSTLSILRRLLTDDPGGGIPEDHETHHFLPVPNCADRRGSLRALWNPIIPEIRWTTANRRRRSSVQVYLDVSASMGSVLGHLVRLLHEFGGHVRRPLWAFSTQVSEASIVAGELRTGTTGGTSLSCVYEHLRKTSPRKALIITDGYVEGTIPPSPLPCVLEAIIPHDGHDAILAGVHGIPVTRLAPMPSAGRG